MTKESVAGIVVRGAAADLQRIAWRVEFVEKFEPLLGNADLLRREHHRAAKL